jgi:hypothetical protein
MFISKAEKSNLYKLIAELQMQLRDDRLNYADQLSNDIANMKADIRRLQVSKIVEVVNGEKTKRTENIEHIKHERKKAYMREHYHRRKAERLENEAKLKLAQESAAPASKVEEKK